MTVTASTERVVPDQWESGLPDRIPARRQVEQVDEGLPHGPGRTGDQRLTVEQSEGQRAAVALDDHTERDGALLVVLHLCGP